MARCATCGRTGKLSTYRDGYWCGWCGDERAISIESIEVRPKQLAPDGSAIDPESVPLQPLRITSGWEVAYNNALYAVDPTEETVRWWWIFKEDMLVLVHAKRRRLLDLGWSPEMDHEEGRYRLTLYEDDHRGKVLREYEGRDREDLVEEIENILSQVTNGRL